MRNIGPMIICKNRPVLRLKIVNNDRKNVKKIHGTEGKQCSNWKEVRTATTRKIRFKLLYTLQICSCATTIDRAPSHWAHPQVFQSAAHK